MIQITNIHKAFGANQVLKGIDLSIDKGKVVVILRGHQDRAKLLFALYQCAEFPDQGVIAFDDNSLSVDFGVSK